MSLHKDRLSTYYKIINEEIRKMFEKSEETGQVHSKEHLYFALSRKKIIKLRSPVF